MNISDHLTNQISQYITNNHHIVAFNKKLNEISKPDNLSLLEQYISTLKRGNMIYPAVHEVILHLESVLEC